jgi:hypothetical protein
MSAKKTGEERALKFVGNPEALKPTLKQLGGSQSDDWNNILTNQTLNTLWLGHSSNEAKDRQFSATAAALVGIGPQDEIEGMIGAQLLAAHNAAMECYRRAMIPEQSFEGRRENLNQVNKLSRTYATLLEAPSTATAAKANRRSRLSTSMCTLVARQWSAWSRTPGEGINRNQRINPMQSRLPMHLSPRCGARTRKGSQCKSPAMPNGRCRMHGGKSPGAPKGNRNAWKHGHYSAESIALRRLIRQLLSDAADLVER